MTHWTTTRMESNNGGGTRRDGAGRGGQESTRGIFPTKTTTDNTHAQYERERERCTRATS